MGFDIPFWTRLVKDITVGQQIIIQVITLLATYLLVVLVNGILIREGRWKERVTREAKIIETVALKRSGHFDEVLAKIGQAAVAANSLRFRLGLELDRAAKVAIHTEGIAKISEHVDDAIAASSKLGRMVQFEDRTWRFAYLDEALQNAYTDSLTAAGEAGATLDHLLVSLSNLKRIVQDAADFEGSCYIEAYRKAGKMSKIREAELLVFSLSSELHGKKPWKARQTWLRRVLQMPPVVTVPEDPRTNPRAASRDGGNGEANDGVRDEPQPQTPNPKP